MMKDKRVNREDVFETTTEINVQKSMQKILRSTSGRQVHWRRSKTESLLVYNFRLIYYYGE